MSHRTNRVRSRHSVMIANGFWVVVWPKRSHVFEYQVRSATGAVRYGRLVPVPASLPRRKFTATSVPRGFTYFVPDPADDASKDSKDSKDTLATACKTPTDCKRNNPHRTIAPVAIDIVKSNPIRLIRPWENKTK